MPELPGSAHAVSTAATLVQAAQRTPTNVSLVPIDQALAKRVRSVAQAAEKKREQRDQLIVEAHQAGASLREIAALVGLSHVGVMKIVAKGEGLEASHIVPLSEGGTNEDENIEFLTPTEHARKARRPK